MIKNKITNISNVKLEFFVKTKNSDDTLISVEPGQVVFSDGEEATRSMRVFERKNLITISKCEFETMNIHTDKGVVRAEWSSDLAEALQTFHNVDIQAEITNLITKENSKINSENEVQHVIESSITNSENPYGDLLEVELLFEGGDASVFENVDSSLDEAKKQAEDYVEDAIGDTVVKEKKKYNYKKKPGRKKKRGPKPGSKRKKED